MKNIYVFNLGWTEGWNYARAGYKGMLPDFGYCVDDYIDGFNEGVEAYMDRGNVDVLT